MIFRIFTKQPMSTNQLWDITKYHILFNTLVSKISYKIFGFVDFINPYIKILFLMLALLRATQ